MGIREKGREIAMQALYQYSVQGSEVLENLTFDWVRSGTSEKVTKFAESLFRGAAENSKESDALIDRFLTNWTPDRLGIVERAILRLAVYEILHKEDIPAEVSIVEAVNLARKFCDPDSYKFINGVLDAVIGHTRKAAS